MVTTLQLLEAAGPRSMKEEKKGMAQKLENSNLHPRCTQKKIKSHLFEKLRYKKGYFTKTMLTKKLTGQQKKKENAR